MIKQPIFEKKVESIISKVKEQKKVEVKDEL